MPPSRNGEKPPSRNGEKPPSRQGPGDRFNMSRQGLPMQHIAPQSDSDLVVSDISFETIKSDLVQDVYLLERCSRKSGKEVVIKPLIYM